MPSLGVEIPLIFFSQGAFAQTRIRIHWHRRRSLHPDTRPTGPQSALGEGQHGAAAAGTNPLVMLDGLAFDFVVVAQGALNLYEVSYMHLRREGMPAAAAMRRCFTSRHVFVKFDAQLCWPLEDMEELAEWQPEQREDHRDGMKQRQELITVPLEPGVAHGQQQA